MAKRGAVDTMLSILNINNESEAKYLIHSTALYSTHLCVAFSSFGPVFIFAHFVVLLILNVIFNLEFFEAETVGIYSLIDASYYIVISFVSSLGV